MKAWVGPARVTAARRWSQVVVALAVAALLTAPPAAADPGPADPLAVLETLPIKGRAPKTGYERNLFGDAWTDDVTVADGHNGCDTRNDILRRDLVNVVLKPGSNGCAVLTGVLNDPYTGTSVEFRRGPGTSALPSARSRCSAARASSISVTGVVTTMKTVISTSCSTARVCSTEKNSMDASRMQPIPSVVPRVGAWTRS